MKISLAEEFKYKLQTPYYPLEGFFCQFNNKDDNGKWVSGSSILSTDTFIDHAANVITVTFDYPNEGEFQTNYSWIRLMTIDMLGCPNIDDEISKSDSNTNTVEDFMMDSISIQLEKDEEENKDDWDQIKRNLYTSINLIFNIKIPDNCPILASIRPRIQYKTKSNINGHMMSTEIGKINFFNYDNSPDNLIDRESGIRRVRESLTLVRDIDLLGSMTIKKSGIIQL